MVSKEGGQNLAYFREVKASVERIFGTKDGEILEKFLERFTGYSTPNIGVKNSDRIEGGRRVTCFLKWLRDVNPETLELEMKSFHLIGGWFA